VKNSIKIPRWQRLLFLSQDARKIKNNIDTLTEEIQKISRNVERKELPVSEIFVTFETEHLHDKAWKALSLSREQRKQGISEVVQQEWQLGMKLCSIIWNILSCISPSSCCFFPKKLVSSQFLFRRNYILYVDKSPTPSQIQWEALGVKDKERTVRSVISFIIFVGATFGGASLVLFIHRNFGQLGFIATPALDVAIPWIVRNLLSSFEEHKTASSYQVSQYIKTAIFRIVNYLVLTPLMLEDRIDSIYKLFIGMTFTQPALLLLDQFGNFYRHILGPRVVGDQQQMNLKFMGGGDYGLTERSTNLTKIFFLACWYSTIFPAGFYYGAMALLVQYAVDKYCLLRTFQPAPKLGKFLSKVTVTFYLVIMVLYVWSITYTFARFPYDNVCEDTTTVSAGYIGVKEVVSTVTPLKAFVKDKDVNYRYCSHFLSAFNYVWNLDNGYIWEIGELEEWMFPSQITAFKIMEILWKVSLFSCFIFIFGRWLVEYLKGKIHGSYAKSSEQPVDARFSDETTMAWFIPQLPKDGFDHKFLACDISGINARHPSELLGWSSEASVQSINLYYDFPSLSRCFSVVRHWPPPSHIPFARPRLENDTV